ncbi:hypothetical protein [Devosia riboflavina]|uniref:hypothetical protein n=1 Tax=Devosia riboflavina TaxID=46914 RepID=UPI00068EB834|nr:hypothetical protein [Devosia riboflavina]
MITSSYSPITATNKPLSLSSSSLTNQIKPGAEEEFLKIASMSPAERLHMQMLQSMGLTEEDLAAMDPEARKAIEDEISRRILEDVTNNADAEPGSLVDMMA